jgi:hypothetical protein
MMSNPLRWWYGPMSPNAVLDTKISCGLIADSVG